MEALIKPHEVTVFVHDKLEALDLACPSSDQSIVATVFDIVVLDLVTADVGELLAPHRPDIYAGIGLHSSAHDKLFALRDVEASLVAFKDVTWELLDFSKVDASFSSLELEVDDSLFKVEGSEVIVLTDGNSGGCVVVQSSEEVVLAGGVHLPFLQVVKDQLVIGFAHENLGVFDSEASNAAEGFTTTQAQATVVVLSIGLLELLCCFDLH